MHTCIHIHIHLYMHTCIHAYTHAYIHTFIQSYICDMHTHTCSDTQTTIHVCMHACIYAYIHTCMYACITPRSDLSLAELWAGELLVAMVQGNNRVPLRTCWFCSAIIRPFVDSCSSGVLPLCSFSAFHWQVETPEAHRWSHRALGWQVPRWFRSSAGSPVQSLCVYSVCLVSSGSSCFSLPCLIVLTFVLYFGCWVVCHVHAKVFWG